jgi:hypothetical protein
VSERFRHDKASKKRAEDADYSATKEDRSPVASRMKPTGDTDDASNREQ